MGMSAIPCESMQIDFPDTTTASTAPAASSKSPFRKCFGETHLSTYPAARRRRICERVLRFINSYGKEGVIETYPSPNRMWPLRRARLDPTDLRAPSLALSRNGSWGRKNQACHFFRLIHLHKMTSGRQ